MPADQSQPRRAVSRVCLAGAIAGALLVVSGAIWSAVARPQSVWTAAQADEYREAAAAAHAASDAHEGAGVQGGAESSADKSAAAKQRFARIAAELENARFAKNKLGQLLVWIGLAGTAAFSVGYLASRAA
jgi:hypothetical protein